MPIKFAAKKVGWSQSDKGFVLRLLVAPDDDWMEVANAPLGSPFGVVMVAIDPETGVRTDASPGTADSSSAGSHTGQQRGEAGKPRKPWREMSRAQQAGILCRDFGFGMWLMGRTSFNSGEVADALRQRLGISSRADIDDNPDAARVFDAMVLSYRSDTGQMAEQRA